MNIHAIAKIQKTKNLFLIIAFIVVIYLPLIGSFLKWGTTSQKTIRTFEQRQPAVPPKLNFSLASIEQFPEDLEDYYNDFYGFRNPLIRWHSLIKYFVFDLSPSKSTLIGKKKKWLFYGESRAVDYYRGVAQLTPEQLEIWKQVLEQRRNWLASQGIAYYFVIAPNKDTIYSELMPQALNRIRQESCFDQLVGYLKANSDIQIIDLRGALVNAKTDNRVYFLTDTHWNELGAFISYQAIMKTISIRFPNLQSMEFSDIEIRTVKQPGGDLAKFIAMDDLLAEKVPQILPRNPRQVVPGQPLSRTITPSSNQSVTEIADPALPKMVMFHDSFTMVGLGTYLSQHFRRVVYLWNVASSFDFNPKVVRQEKPDIVIQQLVERALPNTLPSNYPEVAAFKPTPNKKQVR